ncbi:MAG: hypothetical protein R6X34_00385 [Chloroflexota bacterium]
MSKKNQRGGAEAQRENRQSLILRHVQDRFFNRQSLWLIGLIFVVALAAFLRFYRLDEIPPGMWFDEAWSAVAARETAVQGIYPPYFAASFGGMHPAIVYLTRFANFFSGGHPLTIRYALAAVGTLTVLLSFFSYRAIFQLEIENSSVKIKDLRTGPERAEGLKRDGGSQSSVFNLQSSIITTQSLALIGAFILAITFPYLLFTRMGFESSLVTPAGLLVFGCLAAALRRGQARWFVMTGAVLGLSLYSFDTARLLPFAVSLAYWGVVLLHQRGAGLHRHLLNFVWLTLAAQVVFLPLGAYFLQNWSVFTERMGVTTYNTLGPGAASVPLALLRNAGLTLAGLSLPGFGDVIARHNLPGRPVFDVFLSILFWLGLGVLVWRWKRPFAIILISWAGVMLLPVILTDGAPTYTRIFGAIPALAGIGALSFCIPYSVFRKPTSAHGSRLTAYALITLLFLSLAATTYDYFGRWANELQLFDDFQVAEWQAATLAKDRLATDVVYLVPNQIDEAHPTFDLVLHGSGVRTFQGNCLVVQAGGERPALSLSNRPLTYLIKPSSAPNTLAALEAIYPEGHTETSITSPLTGETLFSIFNLQSPISNLQSPTAQFGDAIQLLGQPEIELTETVTEPVEVTVSVPLTWQASGQPNADHTYFIHLYRAGAEDEPPVAQLDQQPCLPTSQWHEGEVVWETAVLSLPPDLPAGDYTLGLGWYTWPSFERLSLTANGSQLLEQRYRLGQITTGN